jgi:Fe2+ transport system protein B
VRQTGTFGAMAERFDGQAGAFAYLLFVLLYFPCVATIGAIVREVRHAPGRSSSAAGPPASPS